MDYERITSSLSNILVEMLGYIVGMFVVVVHTLFNSLLYLFAFLTKSPKWLLAIIVVIVIVRLHRYFLDDQCFLVFLEEWLTGVKYIDKKNKNMFVINRIMSDIFGEECFLLISNIIPYIAIIAICYKISRLI